LLPAAELAERVASLEKLSKIETSGLRAISPAFWSLKKLPEKILAGLPETLPMHYDKSTDGLLRMHQDAQRWQAVLATVPEARCFALPVLGVPDHLLAAVERCEKAFEEAAAEELFIKTVGGSFPKAVDWVNRPPESVAHSPFLAAVTQEVARAAAYQAVVKGLEPLSGRFEDAWYERLVTACRDATGEAEAMLATMAATADDGPRVAKLDRATAKLPVFVGRFLRLWAGEPRIAAAAARRAVEEGWRTLRLAPWKGQRPDAPLVDPRELKGLNESLEELMVARAELIFSEWKKRVSDLDDVDSQRQDLLKLVQETARRRLRASLKQLVERYWKRGLSTMRPVWFAQLDAVASVFPRERDAFDLVIVDEAQGAGLWRALPALIRARRVLIVGDPMQAPPRDDWDYPVLSLARGAFPSAGLWWCWGARNEETWVFPNYAAYGGAVLVGPNVERRKRARSEGLHWVRVEGRVRDRMNEVEADKVVDLIAQALSEPLDGDRYPSVGVTAMTREQAELIRARVDRRVARDPEFRELIAADYARPEMEQLVIGDLFEGPPDTRDLQILSLTSGPSDTSKKINIEFGKLARFDGEGFLLGLVARARCGFTMVTSFAEAAIDVQRTQELGPRLLHAFMVFMRGASIGDERFMEEGLESARALFGFEVKVDVKGEDARRVGDLARDELANALHDRGLGVVEEPPRASAIAQGATRTARASGPPPGRLKVFPVAPDLAIAPAP
ncbi:MAG TPA: hypothetical protein PK095_22860, partial [Myxococcota bacterium]|nr:hypothetical protein [Myxococcota bacterium]